MKSKCRTAHSWFTSAPTATAARIAPTSSCRVQIANRAAFPPGEAREDWAIIRALSDVLGRKLPYDSLFALRQALFRTVPHLMRVDRIETGDADDIKTFA